MRTITLLAPALVLTACSGGSADDDTADFTTANGTPAGVYEVSAADGTSSIVTINTDGTYSQVTPDGSNAAEGTLEIVDGQTCFKVRRAGATALCYTESAPDETGAYTATTDSGLELTVRPYMAPAEGDVDAEVEEASEGNA